MIYLDHAATTPLLPEVAEAMYAVLKDDFANPSAQYPAGQAMAKQVAAWRQTIATAVGCQPKQLHFTSCGTEANNWAISAALWQNRHVGKHIVTTAVEHSAVVAPCEWWAKQGYEVTTIAPDSQGHITPEQVLDAVRDDTALVSIMLVNNELGTVYPVDAIANGLALKNPKTLLHTDAVQGFLKVGFTAKTLGADFISIAAHKISGPKGIGALYIGDRVRNPKPLLAGGAQEQGHRAGTEATAQMAGFAKAVELRTATLSNDLAHMQALQDYAISKIPTVTGLQLLTNPSAPHILALSLSGYPAGNIVTDLGSQGICISAGSACHQGKASHVISALKLPKKVTAGVIRLSFGVSTTTEDVDACFAALDAHQKSRFPML
ncbi:cysteine desulfurase family protein [Bengtsoniella intestinalis]|uniref:cysteine desulfurase family protein n=1 Tax=Bengtsoniella intestinalis TaxID=3073143 RepID=UPI00391FA4FE